MEKITANTPSKSCSINPAYCKFIHEAHEAIGKAFQAKKHELQRDIFFIPSTVNGSINQDLFYNLLGKHHNKMGTSAVLLLPNVKKLRAKMIVQGENDEPSDIQSVIVNGKI